MDWTQTLTIIISLGVPMLAGFAWMIQRMDSRFDKVDSRFERVASHFERIETELKGHGERLARIEGMLSPYEFKGREKK